eukprot:GHVP01021800.1.p1 GENE.GHVP01021800.1~~GHVP01021800.1.p1  ORF type:complete len:525 (-),score=117.80 GHVP01021800.1:48-1622(-)
MKKNLTMLSGATQSSQHSFDQEEKAQYVLHLNDVLFHDTLIADKMPIDPTNDDLFHKIQDGLILCSLITNSASSSTYGATLLDVRALNTNKILNKFQMIENNNLAINSAKALGCHVVNIGSNDLIEGTEHLVLGLLWQIIKKSLLDKVSLKHHPEISRLLLQGEELDGLLKLQPEEILIRWFNHHLKRSRTSRRISNLGSDLTDSECYIHLLNQLSPDKCYLDGLQENDLIERAEIMLNTANQIGCRKYITPKTIIEGNPRLNLAFIANVFNEYPGLKQLSKEEENRIDQIFNSNKDDREGRMFALWLSSITEEMVLDLNEDLKNGIVLLKALDIIEPGCVKWFHVNQKGNLSVFQKLENTNQVIEICKRMKFSLIGTGGSDITNGNRTLTFGLVWQIMRKHITRTLAKQSSGGIPTDKEIVDKVNEHLEKHSKEQRLEGLDDSCLKTGKIFIDLIDCIRPGVVNYNLVKKGDNEEEQKENGLYAISLARKIGAVMFVLPEDLIELRKKMILCFLSAVLNSEMN